MEIGIFQAAFDGYAGHIQFLGQPAIAVAIVPNADEKGFSVLLAGKGEDQSLKVGFARFDRKKINLKVTLDSPLLKLPIEAEMTLRASREGTYTLRWER